MWEIIGNEHANVESLVKTNLAQTMHMLVKQ